MIFFKKHTGKPTITYDEAVEEALCSGWIDSIANRLDDERHLLLFTPRKKGSPWSRLNKIRVAKLLKDKQIMPAGMEKIKHAKANGSWNIYDEVEDLVIPADLTAGLKHTKGALENFTKFSPSAKKGILWWIKSANRPETRAARITKLAESAGRGKNPLAF